MGCPVMIRTFAARQDMFGVLITGGITRCQAEHAAQCHLLHMGMDAPDDLTSFCATRQAKHIGKVVVGGPGNGTQNKCHGTAVVTGGMGALGAVVTGWLARQGSRRLVLLGRSARGWRKDAACALLGLPHSPAFGALVTLRMADASTEVCHNYNKSPTSNLSAFWDASECRTL